VTLLYCIAIGGCIGIVCVVGCQARYTVRLYSN